MEKLNLGYLTLMKLVIQIFFINRKLCLELHSLWTKFYNITCVLQKHGNQLAFSHAFWLTKNQSAVCHSQHFTTPTSHHVPSVAVDAKRQTKLQFYAGVFLSLTTLFNYESCSQQNFGSFVIIFLSSNYCCKFTCHSSLPLSLSLSAIIGTKSNAVIICARFEFIGMLKPIT